MITILTKNDCPNCAKLKMFITHALNDTQRSKLNIILKEDNEELYQDLVTKHNVVSLPSVLFDNNVYTNVEPSKLVELISKA